MEAAADTVPVITLTGFLGSGKSTLLNAVLGRSAMPPVAVIVNELGEIPIDHALIENVTEGIAVLRSGCVCCAVRSDLEYTLRDLYLKRVRRVIPNFRAVLLETTGLADPGPVLQTLFSQPVRELRYTAGIVLTTVDCTHAAGTLSAYPEAMRQIAVADRLVLTKSDLSRPDELRAAEDWIDTLNPTAPRIVTAKGSAALEELFGRGFPDALHAEAAEMERWFTAEPHPRHAHTIQAYSYSIPLPLEWERVHAALKRLLADHGEHILRAKGLLQIVGIEQPVVLQAVHHTIYPPDLLSGWGSHPRESRLVVIVDGIEREIVDRAVAGCSAVEVPHAP
jgi:G3E family GTPase